MFVITRKIALVQDNLQLRPCIELRELGSSRVELCPSLGFEILTSLIVLPPMRCRQTKQDHLPPHSKRFSEHTAKITFIKIRRLDRGAEGERRERKSPAHRQWSVAQRTIHGWHPEHYQRDDYTSNTTDRNKKNGLTCTFFHFVMENRAESRLFP